MADTKKAKKADNGSTVAAEAQKPKVVHPESLRVTFDGNVWNVHDERDALRFSDDSRKCCVVWAEAHCENVAVFRKDGTQR